LERLPLTEDLSLVNMANTVRELFRGVLGSAMLLLMMTISRREGGIQSGRLRL
jgi:hypothetical protein